MNSGSSPSVTARARFVAVLSSCTITSALTESLSTSAETSFFRPGWPEVAYAPFAESLMSIIQNMISC